MMFAEASEMLMPCRPFGIEVVDRSSVPIRFPRISLPFTVVALRLMPLPVFPEIRFPPPLWALPMLLPVAPAVSLTPSPPFGMAAPPSARTPM